MFGVPEPPMIRYWWIPGIGLVLGFLLGRFSVPEPDLRRADSVAATKPDHDALRDTMRTVVDSLQRQAREDSARAAAAAQAAELAQRAGKRSAELARTLARALDSARSAGDSVPILVGVNARLSQAVDSLGAAADSFSIAYQREQQVAAGYRLALVAQGEQIARDSVRLEVYQSVVDGLRKASRGCRYFGKIKCLVVGPGYSAVYSDGKIWHGISVSATLPL